jgi:hypothetical protein
VSRGRFALCRRQAGDRALKETRRAPDPFAFITQTPNLFSDGQRVNAISVPSGAWHG